MSTKQPKYLKKQRFSLSKNNLIPEPLANQTVSEDLEKTTLSKSDEKSVCEKYINIYESLNQKQSVQKDGTKWKAQPEVKMFKSKQKVIFENPVIQKSYTKLPVNQTPFNHQENLRNAQAQVHEPPSICSKQRRKPTPSKKNQMTLKLITQNKKCSAQKQNILYEPYEMMVCGIDLQQRSSYDMFIKPNGPAKSLVGSRVQKDSKECTQRKRLEFPFSFWQNNIFAGSSPTKAYGGYYKAKSKKMYQKQRQKLNRNSTSHIKIVDQSIEIEKQRRSILRPKSIHAKRPIIAKQLNAASKTHQRGQSCELGTGAKQIRTQSEDRINNYQQSSSTHKQRNQQKRTTYFGLIRRSFLKQNGVGFVFNGKLNEEFERKNSKRYNFKNRAGVGERNYTTQLMTTSSQLSTPNTLFHSITKHSTLQSTTIPTPSTDSPNSQYLNIIQQKYYLQSKQLTSKMLTSAVSSSRLLLKAQGCLQKSVSSQGWLRKGHMVTLNRIEDAIENDTQMRIQRIGLGSGWG